MRRQRKASLPNAIVDVISFVNQEKKMEAVFIIVDDAGFNLYINGKLCHTYDVLPCQYILADVSIYHKSKGLHE